MLLCLPNANVCFLHLHLSLFRTTYNRSSCSKKIEIRQEESCMSLEFGGFNLLDKKPRFLQMKTNSSAPYGVIFIHSHEVHKRVGTPY